MSAWPEPFDLAATLTCGQCFRWRENPDGSFTGTAAGRTLTVRPDDAGEAFSDPFWRGYFDLDLDYGAIRDGLSSLSPALAEAASYAPGIRILRQEPWEALCSFIISQCNNISRIKGIVERLCESFGEPVEFEGAVYYAFPSAQRIAALEPGALDVLRCGYRAPYIRLAAQAVADGSLDLEALISCDCVSARARLMREQGIGPKVANCVVLFGLYHLEAFPIDVWIRRALKENFPKDFDPAVLGEYAGLAQQYIFYYARSHGK